MSSAMNWDHLYENEEYTFDNFVELKATVVHGFKRGSKELGIPTANLSMEELGEKGESLNTGIYYGWATVKNQDYCAVVSVGWNPYYKNTKKTVEAHLLQQLEDFYDETIVVNLCGFLRKECNFNSLEELISCINSDITRSKLHLRENKRIPGHLIIPESRL